MMKLILLLYVPRSGSTFFANQLDKLYPNILVLPEIRLPKLLLESDTKTIPDYAYLKKLIIKDHQFKSLRLTEEELDSVFSRCQGFSVERVLLVLAELIASKNKRKYDAVVFKCGSIGLWWPAVKENYPSAGYVHVYRDVRAVVNSALHAKRPYHPGQKMGRGDPWFRAAGWNRYVLGMSKLVRSGEPIHQIAYENLCDNPEEVIAEAANVFAIPSAHSVSGDGFSVSDSEYEIHSNVGKEPIKERASAWCSELKPWQGVVSENCASEGMRELDYEFYYKTRLPRLLYALYLIYGFSFHIYLMVRFITIRAVSYLSAPRKLISQLHRRSTTRHLRSRW